MTKRDFNFVELGYTRSEQLTGIGVAYPLGIKYSCLNYLPIRTIRMAIGTLMLSIREVRLFGWIYTGGDPEPMLVFKPTSISCRMCLMEDG